MGPELVVNRLKWTTWPSLPPAGSGPAQFVPLKGFAARRRPWPPPRSFLPVWGALVGGRCLAELKRAGVGHLYAVDPDTYGPDSWLTQPIPSTGHAGFEGGGPRADRQPGQPLRLVGHGDRLCPGSALVAPGQGDPPW